MTLLFEHKPQDKSAFRLPRSLYLDDLAVEIFRRASQVGISLNPITRGTIQILFDELECYYASLIEGRKANFRDIQNSIKQHYDPNLIKRSIQKENFANIDVQRKIRTLIKLYPETKICSLSFLTWIYREFFQKSTIDPDLIPDQYLKENSILQPIMLELEKSFDPDKLNHMPQIIALAASYRFLTETQPFIHNNAKITRFFSNAYIHKIKIDSYGLWSLSRGLATHHFYNQNLTVKNIFSNIDMIKSTEYFLEMILDQINFSNLILDPVKLQKRISIYAEEMNKKAELPIEANQLLLAVFYQGELFREKIPHITGLNEETAKHVLASCLNKNLLFSETPEGPVRLRFPLEVLEDYFPNLLIL